MSQLVWLRGTQTAQCTHCAVDCQKSSFASLRKNLPFSRESCDCSGEDLEPLKHSSDDFRLLRESPSEFECSSLRKCCWQAHCDSKKRLFMNDFKIRTGILLGRSKRQLKMVCFRLAITGFNFVICFQEHQCTAVASPLDSWSYPNLALASSASIDPIGKSPNLNWKTRPEKSSNR